MFIFTARVTRKKLAVGAAALFLVFACVLTVGRIGRTDSVGTAANAVSDKVKTNEDKIAYLESFGWQVKQEPVAVEELMIPEEFDSTYEEYLALQTEQDFDLSRYSGKRVKRFTYEITNYPTGETGVQASLLIYKDRVIGGQVLSAKLDGFLHGLAMPK